jgi:hypothetical protein
MIRLLALAFLLPVAAVAQTPVIVAAAPPDWSDTVVKIAVALTPIVLGWFAAEYRRRTGNDIDAKQIASAQSAMTTAAGLIQTMLDQKKITVAEVTPGNEKVIAQVKDALLSVSDSAAAQGLTVENAARIVVAKVDTSPKPQVIAVAAASPATPDVVAAQVPVDRVERTPFSFPKE